MLATPTPGPHRIHSDDRRDSEEAVSLPLTVKGQLVLPCEKAGRDIWAVHWELPWAGGPTPQLPTALLLPVPMRNTSQHVACKPGPSRLLPQLAGETKIEH